LSLTFEENTIPNFLLYAHYRNTPPTREQTPTNLNFLKLRTADMMICLSHTR